MAKIAASKGESGHPLQPVIYVLRNDCLQMTAHPKAEILASVIVLYTKANVGSERSLALVRSSAPAAQAAGPEVRTTAAVIESPRLGGCCEHAYGGHDGGRPQDSETLREIPR